MKYLRLGVILFALTNFAHATLITHNDYTLNTDTNIVTHGSLQWLQWDETSNTSISDFYNDAVLSKKWKFASSQQMSDLFNDWFPQGAAGGESWDSDNSTRQKQKTGYGQDEAQVQFIEIFGVVEMSTCPVDKYTNEQADYIETIIISCPTTFAGTSAYYVDEGSTAAAFAQVDRGYKMERTTIRKYFDSSKPVQTVVDILDLTPAYLELTHARYNFSRTGLALVRVSEPSTILLFSLGLVSLVSMRRRQYS